MYPENHEGTPVIVGSMNMGYIFDTARNRTNNLFRPKRESIPLGHSDGQSKVVYLVMQNLWRFGPNDYKPRYWQRYIANIFIKT